VLEVDEVLQVRVADIGEADARQSGFDTLAQLLEYMKSASDEPLTASTQVFRVKLHHGGDGDRVELALDDRLSDEDIQTIKARLARLDAKRPWTRKALAIIAERPRVAASQLAAALKRDKLEFKEDIRKLKKLGLTQSFEVGYEISARGRAYLAAASAPKRKAVSSKRLNKETGRRGD
jgi:hypothetical protein